MRGFLLGLIAVTACSPVVDRHTPDASVHDAAPDAQSHGLVTVKLLDLAGTGAVAVGIPVVFFEADGTLAAQPLTGTDGTAAADVKAGASVTAVYPRTNGAEMYSVLGVKPGDNITIGQVNVASQSAGTFQVSFPAFTGATGYTVFGPCGSVDVTASPATLTMYSDCKLDTMDVLVFANTSAARWVAYIDTPNVAFTSGGTQAVTGTYATPASFTTTYSNITGVSNISVNRAMPDSQYGYTTGTSGTVTTSTLGLMVNGAAGSSATVRSTFNNTTGSQQQLIQRIAGNAQTDSIDVGATLLPWVGQSMLDLTNHKITTPLDMTGTTNDTPDMFLADAVWSRGTGSTQKQFGWIVFAGTAGDITLPSLPLQVGDVMPKVGDTSNGAFGGIIESDSLSGWDAVRANPFAALVPINTDRSTATKSRLSTYQGN